VAELRIALPTVVTVLASAEACDGVEASSMLRVAPGEVMVVGAAATAVTAGEPTALVADVSDAWVAFVIDGDDAPDVFARLSELALPPEGWIQGEIAHAACKVFVEPASITIYVPAMLAAHIEERIRTDAAEVLAS
jgi:sarcosine oxidase gamma subunit